MADNVPQLVYSSHGGKKLWLNGFAYYNDKKRESVYYWCCVDRVKMKCKARLLTILEGSIHKLKRPPGIHTHEPSAINGEVDRTSANVRELATTSHAKVTKIINNVTNTCDIVARPYLPSTSALRQRINRRRQATRNKEPTNIDDIEIPDDLKTVDGDDFLICFTKFNSKAVLLFGTPWNLTRLAQCSCWIMDGTFKVVPSIFRQLYVIHGLIKTSSASITTPLVYCLMTDKSEDCYSQMVYELLKKSCELGIELKPETIITDFEAASVKAFKQYLPNVNYKGCFFHFSQNIWRRIQKEKLSTKYGTDTNFEFQIKQLKCLAYLTPEEIPICYQELVRNAHGDALKIYSYISDVYIYGRKKNVNSRQWNPRFKPEFWSIISNLELNLPITQNGVESWHNRLNHLIGMHPGTYSLINELKKEYVFMKNKIEQFMNGQYIPKSKKYTISKQKRIKAILLRKVELSKIEFLKALAQVN